jgi:hypothetical protein
LGPTANAVDILIIGGISGSGGQLNNNPIINQTLPPNAFVLSIRNNAGSIEPVTRGDGREGARRALHAAVAIESAILISGGWVIGDAAQALTATNSILRYDSKTGELDDWGAMSAPRLGHTAAVWNEDVAFFAGGVQLGSDADRPFVFNTSADIYVAPLLSDPCNAPIPEPPAN